MLKVSENPPARTDGYDSIAQYTGDWWAAHTKARNEKALAWDLLAKGVPYFLPMVARVIFSGGRKRKAMHPLFGGYVFFVGDTHTRAAVFQTDRVCNVIEVKNPDRLVESLSSIERALDSGIPIDAYPFAVVGRRVRVQAGPMTGVVGIIAKRDGVDRLYISVEMLGQSAELPIDTSLVQPFDG